MRIGRTSLGEAAVAAKSRITDLETRRTWLLFGDPTLLGIARGPGDAGPPMDGGAAGDAIGRGTARRRLDAGADAAPDAAGAPRCRDERAAAADEPEPPEPTPRRPTGGGGVTMGSPERRRRGRGKARVRPPRDGCGCAPARSGRRASAARPLAARVATGGGRRRRAGGAARAAGLGHAGAARLGVRLARSAASRLRLPHGHHARPHAHRHLGRAHHARRTIRCSSTSPARTSEHAANGGTSRTPTVTTSPSWAPTRRRAAAPRPARSTTRSRATTASDGPRDRLGRDPGAQDDRDHLEHGHHRQVRRRHDHVADPERERHLGHELQGRLAHEPGPASPQTDSTSTGASASFNGAPAPATADRAHRRGHHHERHDRDRLPRLPLDDVQLDVDGHVHLRRAGSRPPTRTARSSPSATTAPATRSSTSLSATTAHDQPTGNHGRARPRRHGQRPTREVTGSTAVNDGTWHHFAVTRTGGTIQVYVDGASIGSSTERGRQRQHHDRRLRRTTRTSAARGTGSRPATARPTSAIWRGRSTSSASRTPSAPPTGSSTDYNTKNSPSSTYTLGTETVRHLRRRHQDRRRGLRRRQHRQRRRLQQLVHRRVGLHLQRDDAQRLLDDLRRRRRRRHRGLRRRRHRQRRRLQQHLHRREPLSLQRRRPARAPSPVRLLQDRHHRSHEGRDCGGADDAQQLSDPVQRDGPRLTTHDERRSRPQRERLRHHLPRARTRHVRRPTACTLSHEVEKYDGDDRASSSPGSTSPSSRPRTNSANTQFQIMYGNTAISTSHRAGPRRRGTRASPASGTSTRNPAARADDGLDVERQRDADERHHRRPARSVRV